MLALRGWDTSQILLARTLLQVGAAALSVSLASARAPRSCGVSTSPLTRSTVVALSVVLVDLGDFGHKRIVWVRVRKQRADREQHFRNGLFGRPLVLQDVEADRTVAVDGVLSTC